jgi:hypothetical protein
MKKLWLPLAAAALTAAALAAVSVAQDGGSNESRDDGDALRGGPPLAEELSDEDRQALEEFRSCMEDQGVEPPPRPPGPGEGGQGNFELRIEPPSEEERAKIDEAFKACEDKLPEGARQLGPHPCGPPPGAPDGEGAAIPAPPPSSGSQQEGTVAPAPQGASS